MRRLVLSFFIAACFVESCTAVSSHVSSLPPIVIIPGDGSNQIEAKLDKPSSPHWYCSAKEDWFRLWLNLEILVPGVVDCWCDNIQLIVNSTTGKATNAAGVETRVPAWGSTESMEELDPSIGSSTAAFYYMVKDLVAMGYERNVTLRGAPYDFRYTPDSMPEYGEALKALIEETVNATGISATLISHSMGGLQALYFLNAQSQAWKDRYIKHYIAISAPWAGAAKEFRLFASGDSESLPVTATTIRGEQRSYETNHWLMPTASGWGDTVLVTTPSKNYTASDADREAFFDAVGYSTGKVVYSRVASLISDPTKGPGVPVSCLYSKGVDTPLKFAYKKDGDFDTQPSTENGDGDGTVNFSSLEVCEQWKSTQSAPVSTQVFDGIAHADMITNATAIDAVISIIKSINISTA